MLYDELKPTNHDDWLERKSLGIPRRLLITAVVAVIVIGFFVHSLLWYLAR